jgi:deoxyribonuclease V
LCKGSEGGTLVRHAAAPHRWDVTPAEAREIQQSLRTHVIAHDQFETIRTVGGVDVGFEDNGRLTRAAVVVLSYPALNRMEYVIARQPTRFPYVPGLLSFREVPAVLEAFENLPVKPDLLLCDGQGLAHPRRFGFACHIGVLVDLPSIGVAKSRLIGSHAAVAETRGSQVPLMQGNEQIGVALRTRTCVKPLYVSIGHRICLATAVQFVLACTPKYRLPETTRWADHLASRRGHKQS